MNKGITKIHRLWEKLVQEERSPTKLPPIDFNDFLSSTFAAGPFYYYILDFYDFSISNISKEFEEAHGLEPDKVQSINDILNLIHPDDMDFVVRAEERAVDFIYNRLGVGKIKEYKVSYNFRFKTRSGDYQLYNHQALVLTTDEKGNFCKSINIHTNINHLTSTNNLKFSIIGLTGLPSFLDIEVYSGDNAYNENALSLNSFSRREIEIIKMIAEGMETKNIADRLFISPETVKSHRKNILRKAGCTSSTVLVAKGISEGWI